MTMRCLVVDDDARKRSKIQALMKEAGGEQILIDVARSAAEAARALEELQFDLLVLDLNLPMKNEDKPRQDGGVRFLKQLLKSGPRFHRPTHIVGLSAYSSLVAQYQTDFQAEGWQLTHYDESADEW